MENNIDNLYDALANLEGNEYALYDLSEWKNGLAFKKIDFSDEGVPVIKIAELNGGISSSTAYTNNTYSDDVHLYKGDMVFSWSGNPQTSIDIFRFRLKEGWLNQHIFKVTPKEEIVDRDYFYYLMKWLKPIFTKIASNKQTTGLGHITIKDLKQLKVVVPEMDYQKRVVSLLKIYDECISTNLELIENLSEQIRSIFKARFVDYLPYGGKAPNGWKNVKLGDIAEIKTKSFSPQKNPDVEVEHYSIPAYDETGFPVYENTNEIKSNKYLITHESILVSKLNPTIKRIWRPFCLHEVSICSTEFIVYNSKEKKNTEFLFALLDSKSFSDHLCANVTGSTGSRQRAMPKATLEFSFLLPSQIEIDEFCNDVSVMSDAIESALIENSKLSMMRDAILPKLLSGEINANDIQIN